MNNTSRCEQWVVSCANHELTDIWASNPDKVRTLRICQKHFIPQFLGTTSRLVGHAVPIPFGVSMETLNIEQFMIDCSNNRIYSETSSETCNQHVQQFLPDQPMVQEAQDLLVNQQVACYYDGQLNQQTNIEYGYNDNYDQHLIIRQNGDNATNQQTSNEYIMTSSDGNYHQLLPPNRAQDDINAVQNMYTSSSHPHFETTCDLPNQAPTIDITQTSSYVVDQNSTNVINEPILYQPEQPQNTTTVPDYQDPDCSGYYSDDTPKNVNPRINYDREGNVVSIQYPSKILYMMRSDIEERNAALIDALKHKVRHYQRKSAVTNHRYQKLKSKSKVSSSNRVKLLECLKVCKNDFDPCVFEIFRRQIKKPVTKHGNRWSDKVKSFSSDLYLKSRSAYRHLRKTIDLPSEFIVKRFIEDKKITNHKEVAIESNIEQVDDHLFKDISDINIVSSQLDLTSQL